MNTVMRAKMQVQEVTTETEYEGCESVKLSAVCSSAPYGANGENEDNTFARYTPFATLEIQIKNPDLIGKFKPGQKFYLDFTEAAE